MGLVARHLEEHGVPTIVLGSARDVVEHCGVPRFYFVDFPLGNPCGEPYDRNMQKQIVKAALGMLETAEQPRAFARAPFAWRNETWRAAYMYVDPADVEKMRTKGAARRAERQALRDAGRVRNE